jgi:hypothetical protein
MVIVAQDRSAVLLVRLWTEGDPAEFRARVTAVDTSAANPTGEELIVAVASAPSELVDALRTWLEEFLHPGG